MTIKYAIIRRGPTVPIHLLGTLQHKTFFIDDEEVRNEIEKFVRDNSTVILLQKGLPPTMYSHGLDFRWVRRSDHQWVDHKTVESHGRVFPLRADRIGRRIALSASIRNSRSLQSIDVFGFRFLSKVVGCPPLTF